VEIGENRYVDMDMYLKAKRIKMERERENCYVCISECMYVSYISTPLKQNSGSATYMNMLLSRNCHDIFTQDAKPNQ